MPGRSTHHTTRAVLSVFLSTLLSLISPIRRLLWAFLSVVVILHLAVATSDSCPSCLATTRGYFPRNSAGSTAVNHKEGVCARISRGMDVGLLLEKLPNRDRHLLMGSGLPRRLVLTIQFPIFLHNSHTQLRFDLIQIVPEKRMFCGHIHLCLDHILQFRYPQCSEVRMAETSLNERGIFSVQPRHLLHGGLPNIRPESLPNLSHQFFSFFRQSTSSIRRSKAILKNLPPSAPIFESISIHMQLVNVAHCPSTEGIARHCIVER